MTGSIDKLVSRFSRREQLLLLTAAIFLLLVLIWQALWQPVMAARSASHARLVYAEQTLGEVHLLAAELSHLRTADSGATSNNAASAAASLPQLLNTLAAEAAIQVASLEPAADNRVAGVRFDAVAMPSLLTWLAALEAVPSVQIEQLSITPQSNGSSVNASLRVRSLR